VETQPIAGAIGWRSVSRFRHPSDVRTPSLVTVRAEGLESAYFRSWRKSLPVIAGQTAAATCGVVLIVVAVTHDTSVLSVGSILRVAAVLAAMVVAMLLTHVLQRQGVGNSAFWRIAVVVLFWLLPIGRWALGPLGEPSRGVQRVPFFVFGVVFGLIPAIWLEVKWRRSRLRERSAGGP
jgi:hypothetical protein